MTWQANERMRTREIYLVCLVDLPPTPPSTYPRTHHTTNPPTHPSTTNPLSNKCCSHTTTRARPGAYKSGTCCSSEQDCLLSRPATLTPTHLPTHTPYYKPTHPSITNPLSNKCCSKTTTRARPGAYKSCTCCSLEQDCLLSRSTTHTHTHLPTHTPYYNASLHITRPLHVTSPRFTPL